MTVAQASQGCVVSKGARLIGKGYAYQQRNHGWLRYGCDESLLLESMGYSIHSETEPNDDDVRVLMRGIHDHNTQHSGAGEAQTLALFLRDEQGVVVGGTYGWTAFGWLRIDVLWVREDLRGRGFGKQLLEAAEAEGIRRGCQYATLDSLSFQAPELYKRNGYEEFAVLDKIGENQTWHFLKKNLKSEI